MLHGDLLQVEFVLKINNLGCRYFLLMFISLTIMGRVTKYVDTDVKRKMGKNRHNHSEILRALKKMGSDTHESFFVVRISQFISLLIAVVPTQK